MRQLFVFFVVYRGRTLVEPTPVYQAVAMATILAPTQNLPRGPPGRRGKKPWQCLRGGENCCHGDRLGTQGVGSTCEHHNTSDLQKSRHLQKSRVTERHNRGTKRKLKSHPPPEKRREAPFFAPGATSIFALCPDCAAPRRDFFANDVTSASHW